MTTPDHIRTHRHSSHHREEVLRSELCGCFYCGTLLCASAIEDWTDEWQGMGQTALCPHCGIDSVIGSESGYPITRAFLAQMQAHWFGCRDRVSMLATAVLSGDTGRAIEHWKHHKP